MEAELHLLHRQTLARVPINGPGAAVARTSGKDHCRKGGRTDGQTDEGESEREGERATKQQEEEEVKYKCGATQANHTLKDCNLDFPRIVAKRGSEEGWNNINFLAAARNSGKSCSGRRVVRPHGGHPNTCVRMSACSTHSCVDTFVPSFYGGQLKLEL